MPINKRKYEQAILYLCSKLGGQVRGKKKLAKLLYFADFDFFEKFEKPITGDVYKALPMGPYPTHLEDIAKLLKKTKQLEIKNEKNVNGYKPTEIYICKGNPDIGIFTGQEIKILDRVVLKYGHLTGRQLEDLSHAEAPYIGTAQGENIAYELAFYRGTDFSNNA